MSQENTSQIMRRKLLEKYSNDLWDVVKKHWIQLKNGDIRIENCNIPWFGDISFWVSDLKKRCSSELFKAFPASLKNPPEKPTKKPSENPPENSPEKPPEKPLKKGAKEVGMELHNLLPQNDLVKAFLPIILTNYFSIHSTFGNKDILTDGLYDDNDNAFLKQWKKRWLPLPWEKRYEKLSYTDCKTSNIGRTLPVYANAIQFLYFLRCTKSFCNIGLSFYMFDSFTGYLRLFDSRAFYYITKVEEEYTQRFENIKETEAFPSELLTKKTEYDEKIIEFIDEIISNLHTLKKFNAAGKYEKPIPLNRDFLFFLKNLKLELLYKSGGISLDENDPLCEVQMLDDIIMERLFNPNIDGIVDKMPLELQKGLEF